MAETLFMTVTYEYLFASFGTERQRNYTGNNISVANNNGSEKNGEKYLKK